MSCSIYRSQTQLGSGVAVALARLAAIAPIGPLSLGTSYAMGAALKRPKKKIISLVTLATFQVRVCLVATILDRTEIEHFHHLRKFFWITLV